jgi:hypothetical protein
MAPVVTIKAPEAAELSENHPFLKKACIFSGKPVNVFIPHSDGGKIISRIGID